jgi:hypothetical protein
LTSDSKRDPWQTVVESRQGQDVAISFYKLMHVGDDLQFGEAIGVSLTQRREPWSCMDESHNSERSIYSDPRVDLRSIAKQSARWLKMAGGEKVGIDGGEFSRNHTADEILV